MEMVFRYSEQVEKCHFGQKSDIHFQLAKERSQLVKQKTIVDKPSCRYQTNGRKKMLQKSNTNAEQYIRNENFYCSGKKLSIFDDNKCSVVILATNDSIKIYHSKCSFSQLKLLEPDAIIPYHQIKMIKFFSDLETMNSDNNNRSFTVELNPHIDIIPSEIYTFTYSKEHIVSATTLHKTLHSCTSEIELSDESCCSGPKNNTSNKHSSTANSSCILGLWCRLFRRKNKYSKNYNPNDIKCELLPSGGFHENVTTTPKLRLSTISKKCYFQTRMPVQNINLNTSELFQDNDQINIPTISNNQINDDEFLPAKPHELVHSYMIIYLNPDFQISNVNKKSTLNLYDLRFQIASYSAILFKRFINSSYASRNVPSTNFIKRTLDSNVQECWVDNTEINVPPIDIRSRIMTNELYIAISDYLPPSSIYQKLVLLYSSDVHGTSLKTLYRNCLDYDNEYGVLLIKENTGNIFGAIISQLPKVSRYHYGNGSSSVFRYEPNCQFIKDFKWSGRNSYIIKGDADSISVGGGKTGASIWLNEDLVHGRTHISETFLNEQLSDNENFTSTIVELWTFESY